MECAPQRKLEKGISKTKYPTLEKMLVTNIWQSSAIPSRTWNAQQPRPSNEDSLSYMRRHRVTASDRMGDWIQWCHLGQGSLTCGPRQFSVGPRSNLNFVKCKFSGLNGPFYKIKPWCFLYRRQKRTITSQCSHGWLREHANLYISQEPLWHHGDRLRCN